MEDDPKFVCSACEKDFSSDTSKVMTECRVCRRIHCKDCVDEFGRCIECRKTEKGEQ